jgi:capsular polysaccharide biosynthesis protein
MIHAILGQAKRMVRSLVNQVPVSSLVIGTPRKCLSLQEYLDLHGAGQLMQLSADEYVKLPPPILNTEVIPAAFVTERQVPGLQVAVLEKGRVWGMNGAVISGNDEFIYDVSREFGIKTPCKDHSVFYNIKFKKPAFYKGHVAVVTTAGSGVFYHWMLDILPRLLLLKETGWMEKLDFIVLNYHGLPFQVETLELLGIKPNQIINSKDDRNFHIQAENLVVPVLTSQLNEVNSWECRMLKKYLYRNESNGKPLKRIYISRKKAGNRTIVNEQEILQYLEQHDFHFIEMESYSIAQQMELFHQAEIIAGPHGSAFANIVFSNPDAKLLDILPETNLITCFYAIAAQLGIKYYGFIGKGVPMNSSRKNDNIMVDLPEFSKFFETKVLS